MQWLRELRGRYRQVAVAYGPVAVVFHLSVFAVVLALGAGLYLHRVELDLLAQALLSAVGAGWVLTQMTSPVRFALTIVATPVLARLLRGSANE